MPTAPDWAVTWADLAGGLGAIIVLTAGVWLVLKFVHPLLVRLGLVMDLILGRPAQQGIPGQPSMVERIDAVATDVTEVKKKVVAVETTVTEVQAQVKPNHGTSAHDKIISQIAAVNGRVDELTQVLGRVYGIEIDPGRIDSGTPGV